MKFNDKKTQDYFDLVDKIMELYRLEKQFEQQSEKTNE